MMMTGRIKRTKMMMKMMTGTTTPDQNTIARTGTARIAVIATVTMTRAGRTDLSSTAPGSWMDARSPNY